mgnify:CR=1 FL=1
MSRSPKYLNYIQSKKWREKSNKCLVSTKKHCVLFPWLKARHSHHLTYRNLGDEKLIRDIVPLSKTAHSIIHWYILWGNGRRKRYMLRPYVNCYLRFCTLCSIIFWRIFR